MFKYFEEFKFKTTYYVGRGLLSLLILLTNY